MQYKVLYIEQNLISQKKVPAWRKVLELNMIDVKACRIIYIFSEENTFLLTQLGETQFDSANNLILFMGSQILKSRNRNPKHWENIILNIYEEPDK